MLQKIDNWWITNLCLACKNNLNDEPTVFAQHSDKTGENSEKKKQNKRRISTKNICHSKTTTKWCHGFFVLEPKTKQNENLSSKIRLKCFRKIARAKFDSKSNQGNLLVWNKYIFFAKKFYRPPTWRGVKMDFLLN